MHVPSVCLSLLSALCVLQAASQAFALSGSTADLTMFLTEMSSAAYTRAFFPQLQPLKPAFDSELAPVWPI